MPRPGAQLGYVRVASHRQPFGVVDCWAWPHEHGTEWGLFATGRVAQYLATRHTVLLCLVAPFGVVPIAGQCG